MKRLLYIILFIPLIVNSQYYNDVYDINVDNLKFSGDESVQTYAYDSTKHPLNSDSTTVWITLKQLNDSLLLYAVGSDSLTKWVTVSQLIDSLELYIKSTDLTAAINALITDSLRPLLDVEQINADVIFAPNAGLDTIHADSVYAEKVQVDSFWLNDKTFYDSTFSIINQFKIDTQLVTLPQMNDSISNATDTLYGPSDTITELSTQYYVQNYVDGLGFAIGESILFLHSEASDVAGYNDLLQEVQEDPEATDDTTVNSSDGSLIIQEFITGILNLEVLPDGIWIFMTWLAVDNATGETTDSIKVYKRSSLGVETELFGVVSDEINNTTPLKFTIETAQPAYDIDLTDRLVVKYLAQTTSVGDRVVTMYYEGSERYSHIHTPIVLNIVEGDPVFVGDSANYVNKADTADLVENILDRSKAIVSDTVDSYGKWRKNGSEVYFMNNVGININNPTTALHVLTVGGSTVGFQMDNSTGGATSGILFQMKTGGVNRWGFGQGVLTAGHNFEIYDYPGAAVRLHIDTDGEVGLGSVAPIAKLHVSSASSITTKANATGIILVNSNAQAGRVSALTFSGSETLTNNEAKIGATYHDANNTSVWLGNKLGGVFNEKLRFDLDTTKFYSGGTESFRINPNGYGIANKNFQVLDTFEIYNGEQRITNFGSVNANMYLNSYSATSSLSGYVRFRKSHSNIIANVATIDTEDLGRISWLGNSGTGFTSAVTIKVVQNGAASTQTPADILFFTSNGTTISEKMRFTKNGNLVIGATPTDDGVNKLQVDGSAIFDSTKTGTLIVGVDTVTGIDTSQFTVSENKSINKNDSLESVVVEATTELMVRDTNIIDLIEAHSGSQSLTLGIDNQIPITNAGGTDFEYDANFKLESNNLYVGGGLIVHSEGFQLLFNETTSHDLVSNDGMQINIRIDEDTLIEILPDSIRIDSNVHIIGNLWVDGTYPADFVFDKNYELPELNSYSEKSKELKHLPEFENIDRRNIGKYISGLEEALEKQLLYIEQLEKRISKLENKKPGY